MREKKKQTTILPIECNEAVQHYRELQGHKCFPNILRRFLPICCKCAGRPNPEIDLSITCYMLGIVRYRVRYSAEVVTECVITRLHITMLCNIVINGYLSFGEGNTIIALYENRLLMAEAK